MEENSTASRKGNIEDLIEAFQGPLDIRSVALTGLLVLATFYTLYFAKDLFLPIVLALLLSFLLAPLVRALRRIHIPNALGAAIILAAVVGGSGLAMYHLAAPLSEWLDEAPQLIRKVERQIREVKKPVDAVSKATEEVERLTEGGAPEAPRVTVDTANFTDLLFAQTWNFLFGSTVMLILLFFLLASGDLFLRKLVTVIPRFSDKKRVVQIAHQIEQNISAYLVSITAINVSLGVVVGLAMAWLGMPSPWLWGAMAALFNFVPYLGAISGAVVIGLVASSEFSEIGQILLPPAAFLLITGLEGSLVTPMILGRRLTLNPVVIFINLILWGWIWGIAGALLAVPILAVFKLFCDHTPPLAPIGEFLSG